MSATLLLCQLRSPPRTPGAPGRGGTPQMLAIGRALMANPDLVLMDEPSEGLAPRTSAPGEEAGRRATGATPG